MQIYFVINLFLVLLMVYVLLLLDINFITVYLYLEVDSKIENISDKKELNITVLIYFILCLSIIIAFYI